MPGVRMEPQVSSQCPATCGLCGSPAPPMPVGCDDVPDFTFMGQQLTCSQVRVASRSRDLWVAPPPLPLLHRPVA